MMKDIRSKEECMLFVLIFCDCCDVEVDSHYELYFHDEQVVAFEHQSTNNSRLCPK